MNTYEEIQFQTHLFKKKNTTINDTQIDDIWTNTSTQTMSFWIQIRVRVRVLWIFLINQSTTLQQCFPFVLCLWSPPQCFALRARFLYLFFFLVSGVVCFCLVCVQEAIVVSASSFSLLCCSSCCWYSFFLLLQRLLVFKDHGAHGWRMDICGSQYGGNFLSLSLS
jgi:hypothetical protein